MNLLKEVDRATLKLDKIEQSNITPETRDKITKLRAHKLESKGNADKLREYIVKIDELIPQQENVKEEEKKDKAEEFLQIGASTDLEQSLKEKEEKIKEIKETKKEETLKILEDVEKVREQLAHRVDKPIETAIKEDEKEAISESPDIAIIQKDSIVEIPGMNYKLGISREGDIYVQSKDKTFVKRKSDNINLYKPDYKEFKGKPEQKDKVIVVTQDDLRKIYNDIKSGTFEDIDKYGKKMKRRRL